MKMMWSLLSSLILWCATSGASHAFILVTANVASGYSNCSIVDKGDGISVASVDIKFNAITPENLGGETFTSRGILFYAYNKDGNANNTTARYVAINDFRTTNFYPGEGYLIYKSAEYSWKITRDYVAHVTVSFPNTVLNSWPAVAIRAGNYTMGNDVGEITGAAYISAGEETGSCKVMVDPLHPPTPNVSITVNAPDWNLGEIKRGEQSIPFSKSQDHLCLQYSDLVAANKQFTITASSQNGEINNQYQLINLDDATQIIPYQLALDSGTQQMTLPNSSGKTIPLEKGGKTCFVPTFTTFAPNSIKKGDYSDVLTFNIVTKS